MQYLGTRCEATSRLQSNRIQAIKSPHGSVERPAGPGPGAATPARTWAVRLPPDPLPSAGSCYPALATRLGRLLSELMFLVFISELTSPRPALIEEEPEVQKAVI